MFEDRLDNDVYATPSRAVAYLGKMLRQGSLGLVLGAGASSGIGLPNWHDLVKSSLKGAGLPYDDVKKNTKNDILLQKIDQIERHFRTEKEKYFNCIHNALYEKANLSHEIFNYPLLVAIGALIIGGKRGSVREILNFNFDNVIEYYLSLYGAKCDVIYKLPCLRRDQDATIYHPHGYLPFDNHDYFSDFLILSKYSYDKRLGDTLVDWKELSKDFFRRKVCLFIGLSGDDIELNALLTSVGEELKVERPTGFWLFGSAGSDDEFFQRNLIPVRLSDHKLYPQFLLEICQEAARGV